MLMKLTPGVNFINVKRTKNSYKRHFGSFYYHVTRKKLRKQRFVWKIRPINIDEIDGW